MRRDLPASWRISKPGCAWVLRPGKYAPSRWKIRLSMLELKGLTSASPSAKTAPGSMNQLKTLIREVPDYPKPGILFYDITTLLKHPSGLRAVIDALRAHFAGHGIDRVVGIEARGFIFAPAVAYALSAGFVPMRKPKKLPAPTERVEYDLEYGTDSVEVHRDAIEPGQNVLIVDDVLATGGTAAAAAKLVEKLGGNVAGLSFVIELDALKGRDKLPGYDVQTLLHY